MSRQSAFLNRFRLVLFIVLVATMYTTVRSPFGQTQTDQAPKTSKTQWPDPGTVLSSNDLYALYRHDTFGLRLPSKSVQAQNAQVISRLHEIKPISKPGRIDEITFEQAKTVLDFTLTHPVVGMQRLKEYDPKGCLGFCFGRAMFIHLELLARGVNKDSIRKAYVIGQQKYNGITWQFHVATVVKGAGGNWFIIDPEFEKVQSIEDWFSGNLTLSTDQKLRLYITDADKFGASSPGYRAKELNNTEWYNSYFIDALASFRDRKREVAQLNRFIDHRLCQAVFN